jgi:MFS transporter, DHA1 family, tetracycline resistance protein
VIGLATPQEGDPRLYTQPNDAPRQPVEQHHRNALYLLSALCLILMTLATGTQTLFLHSALDLSAANAGAINANIMALCEVLELVVAGIVGYLSDRVGRKRIMVQGFLLAGVGAVMAPFSTVIAGLFGGGGLAFYYVSRLLLAAGVGAVCPQLFAIGGDFTDHSDRLQLMTNEAFMMTLGETLVYGVLMQIPRSGGVILTMLLIAVAAFAGAQLAQTSMIDVGPRLREPSVPWQRIHRLLKDDRRLRLSFATGSLARSDMAVTALFLMLWCVYFAKQAGVTSEEAAAQGGLMVGLAGVVVMVSIPFWRAFIEHYGRVSAIAASLALSGLGFLLIALVGNPFDWFVVVPVTVTAAGQAGCFVTPSILAVDIAPPDIRGSLLGAFNVVGDLGQAFCIQIGGILFDAMGPASPFLFVGLANLVAMAYAISVMNSPRDRETGENSA